MSIPADTIWELQIGGSDANGGGFSIANKGASGIDCTQLPVTALVLQCNATTSVTGTTGTFNGGMVGNMINISEASASSCYCIVGYTNPTLITVDRATVANGFNIPGRVGGPLATIGYVGSQHVSGNTIWLKYHSASAYVATSITSNIAGGRFTSVAGVATSMVTMRGYEVTRGDETGTRPTVRWHVTGQGFALLTGTSQNFNIENLIVDGYRANFATTGGIQGVTAGLVYNVKITGCSSTPLLAGSGPHVKVEITDCTASSVVGGNSPFFTGCYFHDNAAGVFSFSTGAANFKKCIFATNTGPGVHINGTARLEITDSIFYNHVGPGVQFAAPPNTAVITNTHFESNSACGIAFTAPYGSVITVNCSYFNNTVAKYAASSMLTNHVIGEILPTTSVFVNASAGNFNLNNAVSGGALLRRTGFPTTYPGATFANNADRGTTQNKLLKGVGIRRGL